MTSQNTRAEGVLRVLGRERLKQLRPHMKLRRFARGEFLYHTMQPAEFVWVVRRGEIRTIRSTASGRVTTLELLRPGDLLGMAAITGAEHHAESAETLSAGEAWGVPSRVATTLLQTDPELSRALLGIIAGRLQTAHERLCSFAHERVPERIARTLLDSIGSPRIRTTRRLLAESAGTTVETAIRVLRRFEKEGWIEGGVGWIEVTQPDALERIAAGGE
ncbi:MAG: Crp/Fnr family transcriptional regulator [bacterium]|nr:Crp/Fnr family transcriptional regulator [bacterium]